MGQGDYSPDYFTGYFVPTDGVGESYVAPPVFGANSDVKGFDPGPSGRVLDTYWTDRRAGSPLFSRVVLARTPLWLCRLDGIWTTQADRPGDDECDLRLGGGHVAIINRVTADELLRDGILTQAAYDEMISNPV